MLPWDSPDKSPKKDSTDYSNCNTECLPTWIGDGECDTPCNKAECNFDEGDCASTGMDAEYGKYGYTITHAPPPTPAPTPAPCNTECLPTWIGDEICDSECDNKECNYDGGDCTPP